MKMLSFITFKCKQFCTSSPNIASKSQAICIQSLSLINYRGPKEAQSSIQLLDEVENDYTMKMRLKNEVIEEIKDDLKRLLPFMMVK